MRNFKRFQSLILIFLFLFILYSFTGCGSTVIEEFEEIYLNVPVVKQEQNNWCFPAATKSVMNHYGMEITQEEIADYAIKPENGFGNA